MKHTIFFAIIAILLLASCNNKKTENKETIMNDFQLPEWAKSDNIYEVNIRQYTPEGTINAFSDHIPRLKDMGVDILWLMPVYPISDTKKKGTLGSYYAVSDFTEVNPKFGKKEDLINLIEKVHAYKMKIILDWVPNHTGWDHKWIKAHPDFYTKDSLGNITDPIDANGKSWGWTDVADLNYNNPEMRKQMISDMVYWVKENKIDGFRMDVAFEVPLDFWKSAIDTLTKIKPDIFMLAEAETPEQLNENTFHACYGWSFFHLMNDIAVGKKKAKDIDEWRANEKSKFQKGSFMHFTSNHDENSWNGTEFERMGDGAETFAVLAATYDGIPLIYGGQEEPLNRRLEFFEKDDIGFKSYKLGEFYKTLLDLKHNNPALWNAPYGGDVVKIGESDDVYAYKREKDGHAVKVITNLSDQLRKVKLSEDFIGMDLFMHTKVEFKAGVEIEINPWKYYVISI